MKKSIFRCIAAMAIAALSFSVSAATSSFGTTGFASPAFAEAVYRTASDVVIAAVAATDQASQAAIESKPVMLVHRMATAGEQVAVLGKVRAAKLNRIYADREVEDRSSGAVAVS